MILLIGDGLGDSEITLARNYTVGAGGRLAGMRTGNVTTSELTDATPAAPMAHVRARSCQGPADMGACPQDRKGAGGPGSIADQSVDNGVDILLGGGKQRYDQLVDGGPDAGRTVTQAAQEHGYRIVTDRAGLAMARHGEKLLGLFNAGNMSVEWTGLPAACPASGPQRCHVGQRPTQRAKPRRDDQEGDLAPRGRRAP